MRDHPVLVGSLLIVFGAFTILGAAANWDWFMSNRRAWLFVKIFGRNGARVVYGLLGLAFMAGGVAFVLKKGP